MSSREDDLRKKLLEIADTAAQDDPEYAEKLKLKIEKIVDSRIELTATLESDESDRTLQTERSDRLRQASQARVQVLKDTRDGLATSLEEHCALLASIIAKTKKK